MVRRILITDADNRLGLEFVRQYAAEGWEVFAACREPGKAGELNALGKSVKVLTYDPLNDASLYSLATAIGATPLDVVIANEAAGGGREYLVSEIAQKHWMETVGANTFAPAKLALALQSNLQRGTLKKLVGISSLAASIGLAEGNGQYAYRASKAEFHLAHILGGVAAAGHRLPAVESRGASRLRVGHAPPDRGKRDRG